MTKLALLSIAVGVSVACLGAAFGLAMKQVIKAYRQHYEQQILFGRIIKLVE